MATTNKENYPMYGANHHARIRLNPATKLLRTLLIMIPAIAAVAIVLIAVNPDKASAQCNADMVQQTWVNVDPSTRSIRRIEVIFPCGDLQAIAVGGEPHPPTPTPSIENVAQARIYGVCDFKECDWGTIQLYTRSNAVDKHKSLSGMYRPSFATIAVHLFFETDKNLVVTVRTHLKDNRGQTDYMSTEHFIRALDLNLVASHSGKCLDVDISAAPRENGSAVQQWSCLGAKQTNQLWILTAMGGGYYQVEARHSRKCLDVSGVSKENGAPVHQWECKDAKQANQLWSLRPVGNYYQIVAKHSGKCLDVRAEQWDENGAIVQQWDCYGARQPNQLWSLRVPR
jgi:hypothetical protein